MGKQRSKSCGQTIDGIFVRKDGVESHEWVSLEDVVRSRFPEIENPAEKIATSQILSDTARKLRLRVTRSYRTSDDDEIVFRFKGRLHFKAGDRENIRKMMTSNF
eukprot:527206_1